MRISSQFDSGNIIVDSIEQPENIRLRIRNDSESEFKQWFHFRLVVPAKTPVVLHITNVNECSYKEGWTGYQAVASYDRETWFRVPTEYDGEMLKISHTPMLNSVYYAYFAPFSHEQHQNLVHDAQMSDICSLEVLGSTVQSRDMDLLHISSGNPSKKAWFIARQHPGESMAEWCAQGLINRLLDHDDPIARNLLKDWAFYVVPNMNPDGSFLGNLRSNAAGANLNREWQQPSMEKSPEVALVRAKMQAVGCDFFVDIHGDEAIPHTFVARNEGIPSYSEKMNQQEQAFIDELLKTSPDFQTEKGYPIDKPGKANLAMGSSWVGEHFKCVSLTLEMPFKDHIDLEDTVYGWSPERSEKLGEALLGALNASQNLVI
ncbi:MAG: hypothetical protein COW84_03435 [Gammaproteobacteria bacterium CG22_combo_CG10-13_8_21_14_all_40_8]|nr:MAG: hypothetical protein COW84_03435 [Gammaproteobacteria bacterium CG22_combo_CG10-13_8_21_14_all_40_8]